MTVDTATQVRRRRNKAIFAGALGNGVEWFENTAYASLAVIIAANFFDQTNATTALPAISVPAGYDRDGLPLGAHLMGAPFGEAALIRVASRLEAELRWDLEHPGLYVGEPR